MCGLAKIRRRRSPRSQPRPPALRAEDLAQLTPEAEEAGRSGALYRVTVEPAAAGRAAPTARPRATLQAGMQVEAHVLRRCPRPLYRVDPRAGATGCADQRWPQRRERRDMSAELVRRLAGGLACAHAGDPAGGGRRSAGPACLAMVAGARAATSSYLAALQPAASGLDQGRRRCATSSTSGRALASSPRRARFGIELEAISRGCGCRARAAPGARPFPVVLVRVGRRRGAVGYPRPRGRPAARCRAPRRRGSSPASPLEAWPTDSFRRRTERARIRVSDLVRRTARARPRGGAISSRSRWRSRRR